jgi:hypothetical protein
MIKIDFSFETPYGVFRDAIWLPANHGLSAEEIAALQQERLASWINAIKNPPAPAPDLIEIEGVQYEKIAFDGQILLKPVEV